MNRQRPLQPKQEHHQCSQPILVSVVRFARTATKNPSDAMSSSSETPTSALTRAVAAPSPARLRPLVDAPKRYQRR